MKQTALLKYLPDGLARRWWLDELSCGGFGLSRSLKKEQPAFGEFDEVWKAKNEQKCFEKLFWQSQQKDKGLCETIWDYFV